LIGVSSVEPSTRERLLREGMRLIGDKGFRSVTVAEIESAAGLSSGAGGFYRHFSSKRALLDACLERWIDDVATFGRDLARLVPVDDLRSELTVTARGALLLLARQRDLFRFLGRDADAFPDAARDVHDRLVARGYDQMRRQLRRLLANRGVDLPAAELDALAAIALGSLVHYRDDEARYGSPPADADEEHFVAMWVDLLVTWIDSKAP
jgi:AcrR family transcriptional regulator